MRLKLYEQSDILKLLGEAGFSKVKILKAYDFNSNPSENDEVIICECRK